jgi:hypothetical protein
MAYVCHAGSLHLFRELLTGAVEYLSMVHVLPPPSRNHRDIHYRQRAAFDHYAFMVV